MTTLHLKLSGTKEQQIAVLKDAHPDMVAKDEAGNDVVRSLYNHNIAVAFFDQLTITPAVYSDTEVDEEGFPILLTPAVMDGPFVMVKPLKNQIIKLPMLRINLIRMWESGGAPVMFYGD